MKNLLARFFRILLLALFAALCAPLLAGCQSGLPKPASADIDMAAVLKTVQEAPGGWQAEEELRVFTKDTLFDLMNGQSDAFFVYGFQRAGVQFFRNPDGARMMAAVFQVDTAESAYGLFSANRDPQALAMGNDGSTSPGQRISFWQGRSFVQLTALQPVDDANLRALGEALSAALPKGGEKPALLNRLPQENLFSEPAPVFFHEELSIQDRVWLGGENKLGLGQDTGGVIALYNLGGQTVSLVLVEYPGADRAVKGLEGLRSAGLSDLLASSTKGKLLAAVFGEAEEHLAGELVLEALK